MLSVILNVMFVVMLLVKMCVMSIVFLRLILLVRSCFLLVFMFSAMLGIMCGS